VATREESLLWALATALAASALIAWLILRSVFRREHPKTLVGASLLLVSLPYAALLLHAIGYAISPGGQFDRWATQWYALIGVACASAILTFVPWRIFLGRSQPEFRKYMAVVATVFVIGFCGLCGGAGK
jgi:hypothetical protein